MIILERVKPKWGRGERLYVHYDGWCIDSNPDVFMILADNGKGKVEVSVDFTFTSDAKKAPQSLHIHHPELARAGS